MKQALFCCCCLGALIFARAQDPGDSLIRALHYHLVPDTTRLRLLNAVAYAYYARDPGKCRVFADEAIGLAKTLGDAGAQATGWRNRGLSHFREGDDSLALGAYRKALDLDAASDNKEGMGKTLHAVGLVYNSQSEYGLSIDYHRRALDLFMELKDSSGVANAANSIGTNYLYLADYPKAIEYYQRALQIYQERDDRRGVGNAYTNLGIVYRRVSEVGKAIEYCNKAMACFTRPEDFAQKANVLANLANIYDDMDDREKALRYYSESLQIQEAAGNERGIASNLLNMGIVYSELGEYRKAFDHLRRGLERYKGLGDKNSMAIALSELGKLCERSPAAVLREQGIPAKERFSRAVGYEREALRLAEEIGSTDNQRDVWEILAGTYEAAGDARAALAAYKRFVLLKDSVVNDDGRRKIMRLTMQYEADKKEAALQAGFEARQAIAAAALNRQRLITEMVLVAGAILAIAGWVGFRFYRRRQAAERKAEQTELEMKALRSRMNPHFIFNSLNSIGDYVLRNSPEEANEYLSRFSRLMWLTLENAEHREVLISDDLNAMQLYMELESKRLPKGFRFSVRVDESIDQGRTYIPPLVLQPFIENSIWHGLAGLTEREGCLSVTIGKDGGRLHCVVEDNGSGRRMEVVKGKKRSFGMRLTTERIELLNKTRNYNANWRVTDLAEGTRVEVWLPLSVDQ
ncbi:MAG TPA: tetratricopeptide repeat protein [Puia sp.]|uniref:tetratricopeptide repeat-containing sensor histidine kinase n=1 Tax=Puia sp. TaxID=2045100 RepID=UPI002C755AA2|nr:tetratricopeptide repeat protein [Puia sp.]HVU95730.1 tetratricopeptide repeat protein [Puia sp.]